MQIDREPVFEKTTYKYLLTGRSARWPTSQDARNEIYHGANIPTFTTVSLRGECGWLQQAYPSRQFNRRALRLSYFIQLSI